MKFLFLRQNLGFALVCSNPAWGPVTRLWIFSLSKLLNYCASALIADYKSLCTNVPLKGLSIHEIREKKNQAKIMKCAAKFSTFLFLFSHNYAAWFKETSKKGILKSNRIANLNEIIFCELLHLLCIDNLQAHWRKTASRLEDTYRVTQN